MIQKYLDLPEKTGFQGQNTIILKFIIPKITYQIIYSNIIMKKPSIATTIDADSLPPSTPHAKGIMKTTPQFIPKQYIEINNMSNWLYTCLGVSYLLECAGNFEECKLLLQKLMSKDIPLDGCINVPKNLRQSYENQDLVEHIMFSIQFAKEKLAQSKQNKQLSEEILNFIQRQPKINFSIIILIRSLAIYQVNDVMKQSPFQYLGNELQVFRDYSINPSYKLIILLNKVFNYSIKIYNSDAEKIKFQQIIPKGSIQLNIIKYQQRVYFSISPHRDEKTHIPILDLSHKEVRPKKVTIEEKPFSSIQIKTQNSSSKSQSNSNTQSNSNSQSKSRSKSKSKGKLKDGTKSIGSERQQPSKNQSTNRMKVCLSCGQSRKQDQRFCDCKKRKVTSTKNPI